MPWNASATTDVPLTNISSTSIFIPFTTVLDSVLVQNYTIFPESQEDSESFVSTTWFLMIVIVIAVFVACLVLYKTNMCPSKETVKKRTSFRRSSQIKRPFQSRNPSQSPDSHTQSCGCPHCWNCTQTSRSHSQTHVKREASPSESAVVEEINANQNSPGDPKIMIEMVPPSSPLAVTLQDSFVVDGTQNAVDTDYLQNLNLIMQRRSSSTDTSEGSSSSVSLKSEILYLFSEAPPKKNEHSRHQSMQLGQLPRRRKKKKKKRKRERLEDIVVPPMNAPSFGSPSVTPSRTKMFTFPETASNELITLRTDLVNPVLSATPPRTSSKGVAGKTSAKVFNPLHQTLSPAAVAKHLIKRSQSRSANRVQQASRTQSRSYHRSKSRTQVVNTTRRASRSRSRDRDENKAQWEYERERDLEKGARAHQAGHRRSITEPNKRLATRRTSIHKHSMSHPVAQQLMKMIHRDLDEHEERKRNGSSSPMIRISSGHRKSGNFGRKRSTFTRGSRTGRTRHRFVRPSLKYQWKSDTHLCFHQKCPEGIYRQASYELKPENLRDPAAMHMTRSKTESKFSRSRSPATLSNNLVLYE